MISDLALEALLKLARRKGRATLISLNIQGLTAEHLDPFVNAKLLDKTSAQRINNAKAGNPFYACTEKGRTVIRETTDYLKETILAPF